MADVIGYVYKTTNLVNGKVYIGQHQREAFDLQWSAARRAAHERKKLRAVS